MDKNKEVITGLFRIKDWANFALVHRWMMDDGYKKIKEYAENAIALLKAMDVTPEELERLKKCRHECKIDCLLEHYEKIKAERDALLKAQKPRVMTLEEAYNAELVWYDQINTGVRPAKVIRVPNKTGVYRVMRFGDIDAWEHAYEYGEFWRCWTSRTTDEQRKSTPWATPWAKKEETNT